jgi:Protein of unknown function (DUF4239)
MNSSVKRVTAVSLKCKNPSHFRTPERQNGTASATRRISCAKEGWATACTRRLALSASRASGRSFSPLDRDLRLLLLLAIERLWDTRHERLLAAQSTIPDVVWFVLIAGGALTVSFGSFLGAPSLRMQVAMSAVLAASGALVLILIVALSNPFRGDFRVSTAPFEHALSRMEADTGQQ